MKDPVFGDDPEQTEGGQGEADGGLKDPVFGGGEGEDPGIIEQAADTIGTAAVNTVPTAANLTNRFVANPILRLAGQEPLDPVPLWEGPEGEQTWTGTAEESVKAVPRGAAGAVSSGLKGFSRLTGDPEGDESITREAGQAIEDWSRENFPLDPAYRDSVPVKLAEGGGSMLAYLPTGGAGGMAARGLAGAAGATGRGLTAAQKAGQLGAAGTLAGGSGSEEAYTRAREAGQDEESAQKVARLYGVPSGVVQVANVTRLLRAMPKAARQKLMAGTRGRILGDMISEGVVEGAGAAGQNIGERSYNEDQGLTEDVLERAALGAGSAGLIQGGRALAARGAGALDEAGNRTATDEEIQEAADAVSQMEPEQAAEVLTTPLLEAPELVGTPDGEVGTRADVEAREQERAEVGLTPDVQRAQRAREQRESDDTGEEYQAEYLGDATEILPVAEDGLIYRKDGRPFPGAAAARGARNRDDLAAAKDRLEPVQLEDGQWALRPADTPEAEPQRQAETPEEAGRRRARELRSMAEQAERPDVRRALEQDAEAEEARARGETQKLTPEQRRRQRQRDNNTVRPEQDDLVTAIRKLGGLDTELESDWRDRLSHVDQQRAPVPGQRNLERPGKPGARSLDDLAEPLQEMGYLRNRDPRELEERLSSVERGAKEYSLAVEEDRMAQDMEEAERQRAEDQAELAPDESDEIMTAYQRYADEMEAEAPAVDTTGEPDPYSEALLSLAREAESADPGRVESILEDAARQGRTESEVTQDLLTIIRGEANAERAADPGRDPGAQEDGGEAPGGPRTEEAAGPAAAQPGEDAAAEVDPNPADFTPTHELPDGTQVAATDEPGVWMDADGVEIEDAGAVPLQQEAQQQDAPEAETVEQATNEDAAATPYLRPNGQPYQSRRAAMAARNGDRFEGRKDRMEPVEVDGGWGLREKPVRGMDAEGRPDDGGPIKEGDIFRTSSGRETTPYADGKGLRKSTQWLIDNAVAEAESRGDDFNALQFRGEQPSRKQGDIPPASRDAMHEYLFGQQPEVPREAIRPLGERTESRADEETGEQAETLARRATRRLAEENTSLIEIARSGDLEDVRKGITPSWSRRLREEAGESGEAVETLDEGEIPDSEIQWLAEQEAPERAEQTAPRGAMAEARDALDKARQEAERMPDDASIAAEDLPFDLAEQAHSGTSQTPEVRAMQEQTGYLRHMAGLYDQMAPLADTDQKRADLVEELNRYKKEYLSRYRAMLNARAGMMSPMVAGPAKFPERSQRKKSSAYEKKASDFEDWQKKARGAIRRKLQPEKAPVRATDADAAERLEAKIAEREQTQERMKQANKIIRSKKRTDDEKRQALVDELGFTDKQAADAMTKDFAGRVGFSQHTLSNNNARIKDLRSRLDGIRQQEQVAESTGGEVTAEFDGGQVTADFAGRRLRVEHDQKPGQETRDALKAAGFRWSRANNAWQATLNNRAITQAEKITGADLGVDQSGESREYNGDEPEGLEGPAFSFAGQRAKTSDPNNLAHARRLLGEGVDPETVRQRTGWFQGPDDKWRFEISDEGVRYLPVKNGTAGKLWTEELERVIDHPRLFAAYPRLRGLSVVSARGMKENGTYKPNEREIWINADRPALDQLGTLLHEIQHGIQSIEGFARGSNKSAEKRTLEQERSQDFTRAEDDFREAAEGAPEVAERLRAQNAHTLTLMDRYGVESPQDLRGIRTEDDLREMRRLNSAYNQAVEDAGGFDAPAVRRLIDASQRMMDAHLSRPSDGQAFERYTRQAGEVEARNTQTRMGLTEAERQATAPEQTADRSAEDVIVQWGGEVMENAPIPDNFHPSVSRGELTEMIDRVTANWKGAPPIKAVDNEFQLPGELLLDIYHNGALGEVRGVYHRGQIHLIGENIPDVETAERILLHEAVGHYGLRRALGDEAAIKQALNKVWTSFGKSGHQEIIDRYFPDGDFDVNNVDHRQIVAEEKLAHLAETGQKPKLVQQAVAAIRDALRKLGFNLDFNESDLAALIRKAHRVVERGGVETALDAELEPRMSRGEDDGLSRAREKAGLGGRKTLFEEKSEVMQEWASEFDRDHLIQGTLDKFHGIKRAEERILGNIPHEQSAYVAARLSTGTSSTMQAILHHGAPKWDSGIIQKQEGSKGLLPILDPVKGDLDRFMGWMVARRARRLQQEGRENNLTEVDVRELMEDAEKAPTFDQFEQVAAELDAFKKSVLDVAEQAGLIDPNSRAAWDHADYIPFYRVTDDGGTTGPGGAAQKLAGQSSRIRVLKGGEERLNDPLENLVMNFTHLMDASMKNHAARQVAINFNGQGDMDTEGRSVGRDFAEPINAEGNGILEEVGMDSERARIPMQQVRKHLQEQGVDPNLLPREALEGVRDLWAIKPPADPDVIRVMDNGKARYFKVNDPLLLRSMTAIREESLNNVAMRVMRGFKRVLTRGITSSPDFIARNWIRDMMNAWTINEDHFQMFGDSLRGAKRSVFEDESFQSMLFAGASFQGGYVNASDPGDVTRSIRRAMREKGYSTAAQNEHIASIIDDPMKVWEAYTKIADAVENSSREAVYEASKQAGKSEAQAVFEAKDLMDYSMRGDFTAIQAATDVIPFLNARIQGHYKIARAGASHPGRVLARGSTLVGFSLGLLAMNMGNEEYEELPDWDKDMYWHIFAGGEHFRIPKPFEIGVLFGTVPERIARNYQGLDENDDSMERLGWNFAQAFGMDMPAAFMPGIEVWANRDTFRDAPIEGMADQGKLDSARYNASTSDTMRVLGNASLGDTNFSDATGLSPKEMEHLWQGHLGTMGMYALSMADMLTREAEGAPTKPSWRWDDAPVIGTFYRSQPARSTRYADELYDLREKANKAYRTMQSHMENQDPEAAREVVDRHRDELRLRDLANSSAQRMSDLRNQMDRVYRSDMSPEEKREKIDRIYRAMNRITRRTMGAVDRSRERSQ